MMKNLPLLFALTSMLASCSSNEFDAASYIKLKKDPCFGVCPVYTFTIDGTGLATFHGDRNVTKEGNWTRTLSPEQTSELFTAFLNSDFASFNDEYTAQVTDLPTTWLTFKHGEIDKTVKDYYGAPGELKKLEKLVEEIAEADEGWNQTD